MILLPSAGTHEIDPTYICEAFLSANISLRSSVGREFDPRRGHPFGDLVSCTTIKIILNANLTKKREHRANERRIFSVYFPTTLNPTVVYGHHIITKQFNESLFIKNDFKPKKATELGLMSDSSHDSWAQLSTYQLILNQYYFYGRCCAQHLTSLMNWKTRRNLREISATKKHIQCTFIERELLGFLWFEIILYKQRLIELFGSYVVTIHHRRA
ncbi:hypothetical protein PROFUN_15885 [Planoprotostelium fungivorum]|uniref:Uncharacterized protein n=1 Tax=Planoprotostelium fungivorum TaxID=1890364 RepID=A0A2P6MUA7_9EUKA|nr:hypothetical protein PROFUN_15885 [Planoprotostelium fungivorum]